MTRRDTNLTRLRSCWEKNDGIKVLRFGVAKFLQVYNTTGTISRQPGSGRLPKITAQVKELVEAKMVEDDETTATQLHRILIENGIDISLKIILRCRAALGWTFRGSAYCQLIRDVNKQKRLEWALKNKDGTFSDVIWTDECSVQLQNHRRFCCQKQGERPKPKPRYVVQRVTTCHVHLQKYMYLWYKN